MTEGIASRRSELTEASRATWECPAQGKRWVVAFVSFCLFLKMFSIFQAFRGRVME